MENGIEAARKLHRMNQQIVREKLGRYDIGGNNQQVLGERIYQELQTTNQVVGEIIESLRKNASTLRSIGLYLSEIEEDGEEFFIDQVGILLSEVIKENKKIAENFKLLKERRKQWDILFEILEKLVEILPELDENKQKMWRFLVNSKKSKKI
ncbi:MAG: hypothetical protein ACE5HW_00675 [Candidatus Methanofastidiosia archaeon]